MAEVEGHNDMSQLDKKADGQQAPGRITKITYDGMDNKSELITGDVITSSESFIAVYSSHRVTIIPISHIRKMEDVEIIKNNYSEKDYPPSFDTSTFHFIFTPPDPRLIPPGNTPPRSWPYYFPF
ncbi:MAG: hypothetical protein ABSB95_14000 [Dissulfurispiraceae bacterium]